MPGFSIPAKRFRSRQGRCSTCAIPLSCHLHHDSLARPEKAMRLVSESDRRRRAAPMGSEEHRFSLNRGTGFA